MLLDNFLYVLYEDVMDWLFRQCFVMLNHLNPEGFKIGE